MLNKIVDKESIPGIDLSRMPMIKFGEVDREELVVDLLLNNAPISKADFLKLLNSEYGYDETTANANLMEFVKQYDNRGVFEIDLPQMAESEMQAFLNVLKEVFTRVHSVDSRFLFVAMCEASWSIIEKT